MATGAGNGRKGRKGKEQAAAPAAISEASSDLSDPDFTSAFHPACNIAPRSTRIRMSNVTIETRSWAILGNLQHRLENRNPFSVVAVGDANPPVVSGCFFADYDACQVSGLCVLRDGVGNCARGDIRPCSRFHQQDIRAYAGCTAYGFAVERVFRKNATDCGDYSCSKLPISRR